jgi:hypothetical protein
MCCTTLSPLSSPTKIVKTKSISVIKKSRKAKKKVSFSGSDKVTYRHILKTELQQAWYSDCEYQSFQNDRVRTIQLLRRANGNLSALNPQEQCIRGLEMQATPEIFRFRANGIKSTIQRVLQQQQVQREFGLKDDSTLGLVSVVYSKPARDLATALAAIDSQQRDC